MKVSYECQYGFSASKKNPKRKFRFEMPNQFPQQISDKFLKEFANAVSKKKLTKKFLEKQKKNEKAFSTEEI